MYEVSSGIGIPHADPKKEQQNKESNFFKLFHSQSEIILPKIVNQL